MICILLDVLKLSAGVGGCKNSQGMVMAEECVLVGKLLAHAFAIAVSSKRQAAVMSVCLVGASAGSGAFTVST